MTEPESEQQSAPMAAEIPKREQGTATQPLPGNPRAVADDPPEPPYGVKLLWEEFKLTQDKIDRIGDFHFRVRTWAITLATGLVVAGVSNKVPWYAYLAMLPIILTFNLIDRAQTNWQGALTARARFLEKRLHERGLEGPRIAEGLDRTRRYLEQTWRGLSVVRNGQIFYFVMYLFVVATSVYACPHEDSAARGAAAQMPTAQTPATQGSAAQGSAAQGSAAQAPTALAPAAQRSATQGPATQAPAAQAPAARGPARSAPPPSTPSQPPQIVPVDAGQTTSPPDV